MKIKAKLQFSGLNAAELKRAKNYKIFFFVFKKGTMIEKTISEIKLEKDETITDEPQILSMIQRCYSNLDNSQ